MKEPVPIARKFAKRLTAQQAAELREAREAGATYAEITELYGVTKQSAIQIVKWRTHRTAEPERRAS